MNVGHQDFVNVAGSDSKSTQSFCMNKGGLTTKVLQFATTTATSKICSQLQLLLLLNKSSSLLTTATA